MHFWLPTRSLASCRGACPHAFPCCVFTHKVNIASVSSRRNAHFGVRPFRPRCFVLCFTTLGENELVSSRRNGRKHRIRRFLHHFRHLNCPIFTDPRDFDDGCALWHPGYRIPPSFVCFWPFWGPVPETAQKVPFGTLLGPLFGPFHSKP